jgi:hypothetical protein
MPKCKCNGKKDSTYLVAYQTMEGKLRPSVPENIDPNKELLRTGGNVSNFRGVSIVTGENANQLRHVRLFAPIKEFGSKGTDLHKDYTSISVFY